MAKLSARGRTCQAEITREYTEEQLQRATDKRVARDYPDGTWTPSSGITEPLPDSIKLSLTIREKVTRRLMSDGKVLEKRDVTFRPDSMDRNGRRYSYGWKVYGQLKAGLSKDDFVRIFSGPTKSGQPSPWTVTQGAIQAPVVISQRRIMAAIESGDMVGFCTECGHEHHNVEPDATGYKCEDCGQMAVYGAEELLMQIA